MVNAHSPSPIILGGSQHDPSQPHNFPRAKKQAERTAYQMPKSYFKKERGDGREKGNELMV